MGKLLKALMVMMGAGCAAIGVFHFALGTKATPGEESANSTVDSRERYFAAHFFGYGLAWLWAARQQPVPARAVRWLAGIFHLGAAGRLLSIGTRGRPHWFQQILTGIEVFLPPVFYLLANADEKEKARRAEPTAESSAG